jgi:ribosomal protein S18 acetylase RimI-like enzyme
MVRPMALDVRRIQADEALHLREIRLAALADTPEAFTTTHAEMVDQPVAFWADRVTTNASGDAAATLIAEDVGLWLGMVAAYHPDPDDGAVELVSMWVAPDGRRSGAGRALVDSVLEWARQIGAPSVGLWVMRGNDPAIALYERCGFVIDADHQPIPDDPCADEVRMIFRF